MSLIVEDQSRLPGVIAALQNEPPQPTPSSRRTRAWALVVPLMLTAACLQASTLGVSVNGTCEAGSCPPTALAEGASETLPIDFTVRLADGDQYLIYGTFGGSSAGNGSFATSHDFQVTYEGNATGGVSQADSLTVLADYTFATSLSSVALSRSVVGAFGPAIASGSSARSCVDSTLGCVGPVAPPHSFDLGASFTLHSSGGEFLYDPAFVSDFGAGSAVGSYIVWGQTTALSPPLSSAPEPAFCGLVGLGLIGTALALRNSRSRSSGQY